MGAHMHAHLAAAQVHGDDQSSMIAPLSGMRSPRFRQRRNSFRVDPIACAFVELTESSDVVMLASRSSACVPRASFLIKYIHKATLSVHLLSPGFLSAYFRRFVQQSKLDVALCRRVPRQMFSLVTLALNVGFSNNVFPLLTVEGALACSILA